MTNETPHPHAVRWAKRKTRLGAEWTKWHFTRDGNQTLCRHVIPIISKDALLPEFEEGEEGIERVDCMRCSAELDRLEGAWLAGKLREAATLIETAMNSGAQAVAFTLDSAGSLAALLAASATRLEETEVKPGEQSK